MTATVPRVFVLQPLFTAGELLDVRMLGFQFWIADQLTAIGLEGASGLFQLNDSSDDPPQLIAAPPPTDAEIRELLVANESRYGLLASFAVLGGKPYLALVRLFEVRRDHPLWTLQRWTFDGETNHFAAAAHAVLVEVATQLGFVLAPSSWEQIFGTNDAAIASNYFTALGYFSACDQGFVLDEPEKALRAVVTGIAAGMEPAKNLLPNLVEALLPSGSADVDTLRTAVEAASDLAGVVPASWQPMLGQLGLDGGRLTN